MNANTANFDNLIIKRSEQANLNAINLSFSAAYCNVNTFEICILHYYFHIRTHLNQTIYVR
jgi:hypothetical protein